MCLSIVWMFSTVFASQAAEDKKKWMVLRGGGVSQEEKAIDIEY